jgi:hypothetical protein
MSLEPHAVCLEKKDVVKADFSVLIIMCFERLGGGDFENPQ